MSVTWSFELRLLQLQFSELYENQPDTCDVSSIINSLIKCMRGHLNVHFLEQLKII